jgi:hypothetical protein
MPPQSDPIDLVKHASKILPLYGTPFFVGTSRLPNLAPCYPFFGKLRDLRVWNGVDCKNPGERTDIGFGFSDTKECSLST